MTPTPPSSLNPLHSSAAAVPQADAGLQRLSQRLVGKLSQDEQVVRVTHDLRAALAVDRVALYYFYRKWKGQVTFEALSDESLSIIGMTGADDCFNQEYAQMYEEGRVRAIPDIEKEPIHDCHRSFLRSIRVKANLVVPILTGQGELWGLLAAHHCQAPRSWSEADIAALQAGAAELARSSSIVRSTL